MRIFAGYKIVRTDFEFETALVDQRLTELGAQVVTLSGYVGEPHLCEAVIDADILMICSTRVTERVLDSAKKLKGIIKYGVDIFPIDIEAAKKRQIPVVNIPEYAEETVAEGAFNLLLQLAKKSKAIQRETENNGWIWPTREWMGLDLAGKTLGLVGVGKIGSKMARMAGLGFRMNVLGYDPYASENQLKSLGVEKKENLKDMLSQCDFVSIHCALSSSTRGLLGREELEAMKSSAFLINVSKGPIVDEPTLIEFLRERRIAGAGLDVYSEEPLKKEGHPWSRVFYLDHVILWPHLTFFTQEAMARLQNETLERCFEMLMEKPVLIKSRDPRLRSQAAKVAFLD